MIVFAVDPGPQESGWAIIDAEPEGYRIAAAGKEANASLIQQARLHKVGSAPIIFGVEMIASYGKAVGAEVFSTAVWAGRYIEAATHNPGISKVVPVFRREVKLHVCGSSKAGDANVTQAMRDRFAPGVRNYGKGTKDAPGFFYGFRADAWQAFALAVTLADREFGVPGVHTG